MLHGFPDFWSTWRHQMPALVETYRGVAPDLPAPTPPLPGLLQPTHPWRRQLAPPHPHVAR